MSVYQKPGYFIGLDLGKKRDFTALAVLKQEAVPVGGYGMEYRYGLVHLDRWRGRNYIDAAPAVDTVLRKLNNVAYREHFEKTADGSVDGGRPNIWVLVDQTGVGEAVIEMLRAAGLDCIGITIHGGDAVKKGFREFRVPKRELVGTMQVLLQNKRFAIPDPGRDPAAKGMQNYQTLIEELENFRAEIKLSGHDTYGAGEDWRENNHDDMVLAVAMAAWYGEDQDPIRWSGATDQIIAEMDRELA